MRTDIIAATAALATTASAFMCTGHYFSFFNRKGAALGYDRIDPALFPGGKSPHLHSFDGGNGLSASANFDDTQKSSCTTNRIKPDKSLYWRPTLFFKGSDGYHHVPEQYTKIYYKYGESGAWDDVTEFPENFNMIAGSPLKRSDSDNPAGVRWGCHKPNGGDAPIFSNGFPKGFESCAYGLASEVTFPSCWNGEKLDPKNPNAHMAYPTGGPGTAGCPKTHQKARFPKIFIEFWYDISSFNGKYKATDSPWVLSSGDPTGFGFHADFMNGWEKGVLQKATAKDTGSKCGCGCGQKEMEDYFGKANVNDDNDEAFKTCAVNSASIKQAPAVLKELPGCNPIQSGPSSATTVTGDGCVATGAPAPVSDKAPTVISSAKASLSLDVPNKKADSYPTPAASQQYGDAPKDSAKPTPSKLETPKGDIPSLSVALTSTLAKPSGSPAGGKDGDCKAPVYVTVTPTYYVTAGSNSTACDLGTVTKTLTQTATVTVAAQNGIGYMSN